MDRPRPAPSEVLLAGLIHEMRHPLLGIKAGLELLALRLGPAAAAGEEWQMVVAQVARLEELFRTYQGLFSPERAACAPFDIEPVVERVIELLGYRLAPLGARFSWSPLAGPTPGYGAARAVLHALTNLLANALDALESTAGRLQIRMLPPQDGFVELRISDEGAGIPPGLRERIFTPGFTTKSPGKGNGLGLHLARTVMAAHGGELRLVDEGDAQRAPWARTEFAVLVPRPPEGT